MERAGSVRKPSHTNRAPLRRCAVIKRSLPCAVLLTLMQSGMMSSVVAVHAQSIAVDTLSSKAASVRTINVSPTSLRLMRCGAQSVAACLSATVVTPNGDRSVVISATTLPAPLGRVVQHRRTIIGIDDSTRARVVLTWRPPLFAQPFAMGVVANDSLPSALRDALAAGEDPAGVRLLIALLLTLVSTIVIVGVPRLWWVEARETENDETRELLAARALLSSLELEEWRGRAPKESAPRGPDDSTSRAANPRQS